VKDPFPGEAVSGVLAGLGWYSQDIAGGHWVLFLVAVIVAIMKYLRLGYL
jgi:hypothetical protein